jgi:nucleotide-binding universal stress UspA family protein
MLQIRTILVPVDLSARSGPAVEHGANIAKHFNAKLIVLHAIPSVPYDAVLAGGYPGGLSWDRTGNQEHLDGILADFVEKTAPGCQAERIVLKAEAAELIERIVEERQVDLIVMPTSGRGAFRRFFLGSITAKVLDDVDCAVLTGAHVEHISPFALKPYKKIGCAVGLGDYSGEVLKKGKDFAAAYQADLTVIHAISAFDEHPGQSSQGESLMEQAASEAARLLAATSVSAESIIEFGSPDQIVPEVVENSGIDLLVVGRHGPDGSKNGVVTHADALIRKAPCPVLSV